MPDVVIRDIDGTPIARYDHGDGVLWGLRGECLASLEGLTGGPASIESRFCSWGVRGRTAQVRLGGLQVGAWSGERWQLGHDWCYELGRLTKGDHTRLWLDGALPTPALLVLAGFDDAGELPTSKRPQRPELTGSGSRGQ